MIHSVPTALTVVLVSTAPGTALPCHAAINTLVTNTFVRIQDSLRCVLQTAGPGDAILRMVSALQSFNDPGDRVTSGAGERQRTGDASLFACAADCIITGFSRIRAGTARVFRAVPAESALTQPAATPVPERGALAMVRVAFGALGRERHRCMASC